MSKYLNEHSNFKEFIKFTSDKTRLAAGIIEKDYWVTRVLRALSSSEFVDEFLFKGGTSLSKVWFDDFGRFSEDIDILLLETDSTVKRKNQSLRLKELVDFIGSLNNVSLVTEKSSTFDKTIIGGKFYYNYLGVFRENCPECIKPEILLEPGYRGGSYPFSIKHVNSLLADNILKQFDDNIPKELENYKNDILPFKLKVLNPERILLEKIAAIMNLHNKNILESGTRHFYDIYHLIKLNSVQNLCNKPSEISIILQDISAISQKYYGEKEPLTIEKIKGSVALKS